jgi:methylated-DNA-[protein]-cysteine S-methyltransferase
MLNRFTMVKATGPLKRVNIVKTLLNPKQASLLRDSHGNSKNRNKLTPFQAKVYTALCRVPKGRVTTYKHLAIAVECGSSQAVGQALRRNPHAPTVPCHRVVQSDRSIGGFFGTTGTGEMIQKKISLLQSEGVTFGDDGKVDPTCMYLFSKD